MNVILTKTKTSDETVVNYVTVLMRDIPGDARRYLWADMIEWCTNTLTGGAWSLHSIGDSSGSLWIDNDAEAFAFKMRWHRAVG